MSPAEGLSLGLGVSILASNLYKIEDSHSIDHDWLPELALIIFFLTNENLFFGQLTNEKHPYLEKEEE